MVLVVRKVSMANKYFNGELTNYEYEKKTKYLCIGEDTSDNSVK